LTTPVIKGVLGTIETTAIFILTLVKPEEDSMKWFLFLFSVLWIAAGAWYILYTQQARQKALDLINAMPEKIMAALAVVFGLLVFFSASASSNSGFIIFIGIISIAKGIFIFLNPKGYWDKVKAWYTDTASDQTYRLFGIIMLVVGTAIFSWLK
jgi:uncharacterized protein YjeT (DUF2065 family)